VDSCKQFKDDKHEVNRVELVAMGNQDRLWVTSIGHFGFVCYVTRFNFNV